MMCQDVNVEGLEGWRVGGLRLSQLIPGSDKMYLSKLPLSCRLLRHSGVLRQD